MDKTIDTNHEAIAMMQGLALRLRTLLVSAENGSFSLGALSGLRINQLTSLRKLVTFLEKGENIGYFHAATGSGKTIVFSIIARLLDEPTIIFVPRVDLLEQTVKALRNVGFTTDDIGIWGDGHKKIGKKVVLATYQSHLIHAKQPGPYRDFLRLAKLVVCDEAHRSMGDRTRHAINEIMLAPEEIDGDDRVASDSEVEVLGNLQNEFRRDVLKLGFTATTQLADRDVASYFGEKVAHDGVVDMMDAGVLVKKLRIKAITGDINRATEMSSAGEVTNASEVHILSRNQIYIRLLEAYKEVRVQMLKDHQIPRAVVSCSNIDEANKFAELAHSFGFKAAVYTSRDADSPTRKQQRAKRTGIEVSLLKGTLDMVVTVNKLSEGWDFPEANIAIPARVITSPAQIIQFVGRVLRRADQKDYAVLIEVAWQIITLSKANNPQHESIGAEQTDLDVETSNSATEENELTSNGGPPEKKGHLGDKLGFLEALAQSGEQIERIREITKTISGDSLDYNFGTKSLQNQPAEVRRQITETITPTEWLKLCTQLGDIIPGFGLSRLGTLFNISGPIVGQRKPFLALGRAIYGEDDSVLRTAWERALLEEHVDEEGTTIEARTTLIDAIKRKYQNATAWLNVYGQDGELVLGFGITRLGTLLGFSGEIRNSRKEFIALGKRIYGEADSVLVKAGEQAELDDQLAADDKAIRTGARDRIAALVKATHIDGAAWLKLYAQRGEVIPGFGMTRLGKVFNVPGNVVGQKKAFVELGQAIYGEKDKALAHDLERQKTRASASANEENLELSLETTIRAAIIKKFPTASSWLSLFQKNGEIVPGLAMIAVGKVFKVEGNVTASKKAFIALGRIIYGERDDLLKAEWEREELKEGLNSQEATIQRAARAKLIIAIKSAHVNGSDWLGLFAKPGEIISGFGVKRLGNIFSIEGNPQRQKKAFILVGQAIYGQKDPALKTALQKIDQK